MLPRSGANPNGHFATTAWSKIVQAANPETPAARAALTDLCQMYWYPLYAYLRRRNMEPATAEDTVQAFFATIIENNLFCRADPERGRFRGFLVAALRRFLQRQNEFAGAAKRRPAVPLVSIDTVSGEGRLAREPTHELTPDRAFEYAWAVAVLERASARLAQEFAAAGQAERFAVLRGLLSGESETKTHTVATQLGLTEGAVRVALHRMRQRFGTLLRGEVAATLDEGKSVEDELRELQAALRLGRSV